MGLAPSSLDFTNEDLADLQAGTFLTKVQILSTWKRWKEIAGDEKELHYNELKNIDELSSNNFRDRICRIFCREYNISKPSEFIEPDRGITWEFEDFLDFVSTFSDGSSRDVKCTYAFAIYDFDEDGQLGTSDIIETIKRTTGLTGPDSERLNLEVDLTDSEIEQMADHILQESDVDDTDNLSYREFESIVQRAPNFASRFRIRI